MPTYTSNTLDMAMRSHEIQAEEIVVVRTDVTRMIPLRRRRAVLTELFVTPDPSTTLNYEDCVEIYVAGCIIFRAPLLFLRDRGTALSSFVRRLERLEDPERVDAEDAWTALRGGKSPPSCSDSWFGLRFTKPIKIDVGLDARVESDVPSVVYLRVLYLER